MKRSFCLLSALAAGLAFLLPNARPAASPAAVGPVPVPILFQDGGQDEEESEGCDEVESGPVDRPPTDGESPCAGMIPPTMPEEPDPSGGGADDDGGRPGGPSTPGPGGPRPPGPSTPGPTTPGPSGPGAPGPSGPGSSGPTTPGPGGPAPPGGGGGSGGGGPTTPGPGGPSAPGASGGETGEGGTSRAPVTGGSGFGDAADGNPAEGDGVVNLINLFLRFFELDLFAEGSSADVALAIERRYHSGVEYEGPYRVGEGWIHSLGDTLLFIDPQEEEDEPTPIGVGGTASATGGSSGAGAQAPIDPQPITRIRHFSASQPFNDPDRYLSGSPQGGWHSPAYDGKSLYRAGPGDPAGAHYRLELKSGARTWYDVQGRMIARGHRDTVDLVTYQYSGGALSGITDSRGLAYQVQTSFIGVEYGRNIYSIDSITDPEGHTVTYHRNPVTGQLDSVEYPAREVVTNAPWTGGPGGSQSPQTVIQVVPTTRDFIYGSPSGRLTEVYNGAGQLEMATVYRDQPDSDNFVDASILDPFQQQPVEPGQVRQVKNAQDGVWMFAPLVGGQLGINDDFRIEIDPEFFFTYYLTDGTDQVVEVRQYLQSLSAQVESRSIAGVQFWKWEYIRDTSCGCGAIEEIVEPDGGRVELFYDPGFNLRAMVKSDPATGDTLRWGWNYDSEDRVTLHLDPHAYSKSQPIDYAWHYSYVDDPDTGNPGGKIVTSWTDAGNQHGGPVEWTWKVDNRNRILRFEGPEHDQPGSGKYLEWEYWDAGSGFNSLLAKKAIQRRDGSVWQESTYNSRGLPVQVTTNTGAVFDLTYDADYLLQRWEGPDRGGQRSFAEGDYDGAGRVVNQRLSYFDTVPPAGGGGTPVMVESSMFYDGNDRLTRFEDEVEPGLRAVETYGYNRKGHPVSIVEPDGREIVTVRDERGLAWKITDAAQSPADAFLRVMDYDGDGDLIRTVDWEELLDPSSPLDDAAHRKSTTEYVFDGLDRLREVVHADPDESSGTPFAKATLHFDTDAILPSGMSTWTRNGGSLVEVDRTEWEYDEWFHAPTKTRVERRTSDGASVVDITTTTHEFTPSGLPTSVRVFPPAVVTETHPDGTLMASFEYEDWGGAARVVDEHGNAVELGYEPGTNFVERERVIQDDPVQGVAATYERVFHRDIGGRITGIDWVGDAGAVRTVGYEYDSFDNVVATTDAKGRRWEADFRWDGRVVDERIGMPGPGGQPTSTRSYTWSPGGLILTATDDRGNVVEWRYNGRDEVVTEVQPDLSEWNYTLHKNGRLAFVELPSGREQWVGYDDRGFPSRRRVWNGGLADGQDPATDTSFDYEDVYTIDHSGNLIGLDTVSNGATSGPGGAYAHSVDFDRLADGLLMSETQDGTQVVYERDALGRVTAIKVPGSGYEAHYQYDDRGRVVALADEPSFSAPIARLGYHGPASAISRQILGDDTVMDVSFNAYAEYVDIDTHLGAPAGGGLSGPPTGPELFRHEYGRDDTGQITVDLRHHDGIGNVYRYDRLDRLVQVVRDSVDPFAEEQNPGAAVYDLKTDYVLDGDSHREKVTRAQYQGPSSLELYTTAPDRHHYTAITDLAGTRVRGYDVDGNIEIDGDRRYRYDALDRLVRVENSPPGLSTSVLAEFTYDGQGRRVTKTVGQDTWRYVYAGPWLIEEYLSVGGGAEVLQAQHYYTFGADGRVMSRRTDVADLDDDGSSTDTVDLYFHKDHLGSVEHLTLAGGVVVESYTYDEYGAPKVWDANGQPTNAPPSGNAFLFTGRERDAETGLYHFRARAYDPTTGTFLQEDPLGYLDGLNPVAYVGGNPILLIDPFGTSGVKDAVGDLLDVLNDNADLIGAAAGLLADIMSPLQGLIDLLSAVTGKDVDGWVRSGFQGKMDDLSWWQRVKRGFSGVVNTFGGAVNVIRKLKKIKDQIEDLIGTFQAAQNGDVAGVAMGGLGRRSPNACFVEGTLVWTPDGPVPIEEIEVGDRVVDTGNRELEPQVEPGVHLAVTGTVVSGIGVGTVLERLLTDAELAQGVPEVGARIFLDLQSNEVHGHVRIDGIREVQVEAGPGQVVLMTTLRRTHELARLVTDDGTEIVATPEHPFLRAERRTGADDGRFVVLGAIDEGDLLSTLAEDGLAEVESSTAIRTDGRVPVFNLEVDESASFAVGREGLVVHNTHRRNRHGGGKNDKHKNPDARDAAEIKWQKAKKDLEDAKRSGMSKKDRKRLERQRDHWKRKMDDGGENHSNAGTKGNG